MSSEHAGLADSGAGSSPTPPGTAAALGAAPAVPATNALPMRFVVATLGAWAVVVLAGVLIVLAPPSRAEDLLPPLVASAALLIALLARRRAPGLAWASLVAASLIAAGVPIALSRAAAPGSVGLEAWIVIAGRSSAAAIITLAIAALYATRPERRAARRVTTVAMVLVAWISAGCLIIVLHVIAGLRADPALTWVDVATRPTALFVDAVLLLAAFGVAGDVRAASMRADARLAGTGDWRSRGDARPTARAPLGERIRATLRELVPGEADAGAAAIDAERARLAGDLHAVVLPSLRRAIAEVESGAPVETLADRLRTVDLELERLMADRWPVVLEAFGLVEALEELAERTEAETGVQVVLEIDGAAGRPRPEIERAAWRIAQIALDNAVRHASATELRISISVSAERVWLEVADDGGGIDPPTAADAMRSGGRGLVDLSRRARAVGGSVSVDAGSPAGTVVRFEWPASS